MSSRQKRKARVRALWERRLREVVAVINRDPFWHGAYLADYGTAIQAFYPYTSGLRGGFRGVAVSFRDVRKRTAAQVVALMRAKAETRK